MRKTQNNNKMMDIVCDPDLIKEIKKDIRQTNILSSYSM